MMYEITRLRNSVCVRPVGALGTCGWINGTPWHAHFFTKEAAAMRWIKKQY